MKQIRSFVGMDVHKETISISIAEDGRIGPVRFIGVIPNTPEAVHKTAKQLARHGELDFCYEASGCGYPELDFQAGRRQPRYLPSAVLDQLIALQQTNSRDTDAA